LGTQEALATRGQDARDTHAPVLWLFDSPVFNSGRLKTLVGALARENGWAWEIRLTISPDAELRSGLTVPGARPPADRPVPAIVVSTDSVVLDGCPRWTNLAAALIATRLPGAAVLDLGAPPA